MLPTWTKILEVVQFGGPTKVGAVPLFQGHHQLAGVRLLVNL